MWHRPCLESGDSRSVFTALLYRITLAPSGISCALISIFYHLRSHSRGSLARRDARTVSEGENIRVLDVLQCLLIHGNVTRLVGDGRLLDDVWGGHVRGNVHRVEGLGYKCSRLLILENGNLLDLVNLRAESVGFSFQRNLFYCIGFRVRLMIIHHLD